MYIKEIFNFDPENESLEAVAFNSLEEPCDLNKN